MGAALCGRVLVVWGVGLTGAACASIPAPAQASGAPPPLEAYGKLPQIEQPSLSPDGKLVAYIAPVDGRRCVRIEEPGNPQQSQAICPGHYEVRRFFWKTNAHLILDDYSSTENFGRADFSYLSHLYAADVGTGKIRQLPAGSQLVDILEQDSDHILLTQAGKSTIPVRSQENGALASPRSSVPLMDLVRVNINDGGVTSAMINDGKTIAWNSDDQGHIRWIFVPPDKSKSQANSLAGASTVPMYRDDDNAPFGPIKTSGTLGGLDFEMLGFADQPGEIYVRSSHETGRAALYLYDVKQGRILDRYEAPSGYDIGDLIKSRGHVVGYTYTADEEQQIFINSAWQSDAKIIQNIFPAYHTYLLDRSADGQRDLVLAAGGNHPGLYYLLDRKPGASFSATSIGNVRPTIPDGWLATVKPIVYRARDEIRIHAYLTLPPGKPEGPLPFVVLPHGGPGSRDHLGFDYLAQMIASRGAGVLQPNFRGSAGYGDAFEDSGFDEWGQKMQNDITDATKWLVDQKYADPNRICIVGWSYGGYAALMGAIQEPNLYRCVASMAGVTDLAREVRDQQDTSVDPLMSGDDAAIDVNSPVENASRINVPVLLAHGRRDGNVPVSDTKEMEAALKRAGKTVTAIYFDEDDHYLFREDDRIKFLTALEKFLQTNLQLPLAEGVSAQETPTQ